MANMSVVPTFVFILLTVGAMISAGIRASKWETVSVKSSTSDEATLTQEDINALNVIQGGDNTLLKSRGDSVQVIWRKRRSAKYISELDRQREARRQALLRYQRLRERWQRQQLQQQVQEKKSSVPSTEQNTKTRNAQYTSYQHQQQQKHQHRQYENQQKEYPQGQRPKSPLEKPPASRSGVQERQHGLSAKDRLEKWRLINQRRRDRQSSDPMQEAPSTFSHSTRTNQPNGRRRDVEKNPGFDRNHDGNQFPVPAVPTQANPHARIKNSSDSSSVSHQSSSQIREEIVSGKDVSALPTSLKDRPRYRSLERKKSSKGPDTDVFKMHSTSPSGFMSEVTTVYPFIPTTRALDYLTRYDSVTPPRRWPVKMILPTKDSPEKNSSTKTAADQTSVAEKQTGSSPSSQVSVELVHNSSKVPSLKVMGSDFDIDDDVKDDKDLASFEATEGSGAQSGENVEESNEAKKSKKKKKNISNKYPRRKKKGKNKRKYMNDAVEGDDDEEKRAREERKRQRRLLRQQKRLQKKKRRQRRKLRRQQSKDKDLTTTPPIVTEYLTPEQSELTKPQPVSATNIHKDDHSKINKKENTEVVGEKEDLDHGGKHTSTASGNSFKASEKYEKTKGNILEGNNFSQSEKASSKGHERKHEVSSNAKEEMPNSQLSETTASTKPTDSKSTSQSSLSVKADVNTKPYIVQLSGGKKHTQNTRGQASQQKSFYDVTTSNNDLHDNARSSTSNRRSGKDGNDHTNSDPELKGKLDSADRRWSVSQEFWDNTNLQTPDKSSDSLPSPHKSSNSSRPLLKSKSSTVSVTDIPSTIKTVHEGRSVKTTESDPVHPPTPRPRQSASSAAKRWRDRLKKKQQKQKGSKSKTRDKNKKDKDSDDTEEDLRRGSVAKAFETSTDSVTDNQSKTTTSSVGSDDVEEKGPFIGYKTAYDFLSNQKAGNRAPAQNEARREANEQNRFFSEGMCEIFNKHYVPTRIGGKCE